MAPEASAPGELVSEKLCFSGFACIVKILGSALPGGLNSLMGPRKIVDFQFVQIFSCCKYGSSVYHLFTCWS